MRLGTYYRKELLSNLGIKTEKSEKVLDVGCFDAYWLSTQNAKEKHAIDITIEEKYKNILYKKGSGINLPYKDGFFDKVFSFDVLEHIPKGAEKKFISELIRVTKAGGEVILTTPSNDIEIKPNFLTNWVSKKWGHYKCQGYSLKDIKKIFSLEENLYIESLSCRWYLGLYFPLRCLWPIFTSLAKKLLEKIAILDAKSYGNKGYLLIKYFKK